MRLLSKLKHVLYTTMEEFCAQTANSHLNSHHLAQVWYMKSHLNNNGKRAALPHDE